MNEQVTRRLHRITALITLAALVFGFFFQINKTGPLRDNNPFSVDPYDAIGSCAVQGALLMGLLTYAQALRLLVDVTQTTKSRLIWRGNLLIVCAIFFTLSADTVAEVVSPPSASYWETYCRSNCWRCGHS